MEPHDVLFYVLVLMALGAVLAFIFGGTANIFATH